MPYRHVNGQRLYYSDTGGDGPTLLFSHGLHMDHRMFAPQIEALRDRYRCVAWDVRGHGRSNAAHAPFSYYDAAADGAGLLDALGIDEAIWVGMSQGGYLALRAALTFATRVRALVLIDSQARAEPDERIERRRQRLTLWQHHGLTEPMANTLAERILGEASEHAETWKARWRGLSADNLHHLYAALDSRDDLTGRLDAIRVPTLVIHGEADRAIPIDHAREMSQRLPRARWVSVPGAAHAANLTHPQQVTPALETFVADVTRH